MKEILFEVYLLAMSLFLDHLRILFTLNSMSSSERLGITQSELSVLKPYYLSHVLMRIEDGHSRKATTTQHSHTYHEPHRI